MAYFALIDRLPRPPYLILAATGPLLQAWFSRLRSDAAPYRLYALSNAGSLLALVSYPFVFEPAFTRRTQAVLWAWGFGIFALLCSACARRLWRARPEDALATKRNAKPSAQSPAPGPRRRRAPRLRFDPAAGCHQQIVPRRRGHPVLMDGATEPLSADVYHLL